MEIVRVNISFLGSVISIQGFGTALILARHAVFEGIRVYSSITAVGADFGANTWVYRIANILFSQNPKPARVKVANLTGARSWSGRLYTLVPIPNIGAVVSCKVMNPATGVDTLISHTVLNGDSAETITTDLTSQIDGLTFATCTNPTTTSIEVTAQPAGERLRFTDLNGLEYEDTEPAAGYDTRLSALELLDNDWYGVLTDSISDLNTKAVAAWVQSREKFFFALTQDGREGRTGGSVTGTFLRTSGYDRTKLEFHPSGDMTNVALAGIVLAKGWDQGTAPTWAFRRLQGVRTYGLTGTQETNLLSNNVGIFTSQRNIPLTWEGRTANGRYGDFVLFIDWLRARIRENVFARLSERNRVEYTDEGIGQVKDWVFDILELAKNRGGFSNDYPLTIGAPRAVDVPTNDRQARILGGGGITFSGVFVGAVHTVEVNGVVTEG